MTNWLEKALDHANEWLGFQMRLTRQLGCFVAVSHKERIVFERAVDCVSACKIGSDADLLMFGSCGTDHPGLKQVKLCAAIHLPLDELESCNLTFGLAVGPR